MAGRILICDDSDTDVSQLLHSFVVNGLSVDTVRARDGEKALGFLTGLPALDLIVLDQRLPRKSGREVLDALKSLGCFPRCPVVMLTSRLGPDWEEMIALGVYTILEKPLSLEGYLKVGESLAQLCPQSPFLPAGLWNTL
jgi:CheY-like chemotaxis protein